MKKYLLAVSLLLAVTFGGYVGYYYNGVYIDINPSAPVTSQTKTDATTIYLMQGGEYQPFEIRGVDMGVGVPGKWATDYAVTEEMYIRWFQQIQDMGANTIRVYTILHDDFYNAFYRYNLSAIKPLYLLHGLWVKDYKLNSSQDAYQSTFRQVLLHDSKMLVDVIHGQRNISPGMDVGSGQYRRDISPWVLGYILGVEWEPGVVVYTNQVREKETRYMGNYMYCSEEATPFESLLCELGDQLIAYESQRYKQQRLIAFSNWPTTDPFEYPAAVTLHRSKLATINVEHIQTTAAFLSGEFASYHVYPYFPDYLSIILDVNTFDETDLAKRIELMRYETAKYRSSLLNTAWALDYLQKEDLFDSRGNINTYLAYLKMLNRFHTIPVVISEYGVTTGRGKAQVDQYTGRNQGFMSEQQQGQAIIDCYEDILAAGSAGSCIFTWQDEWFKRTWNTMYAVDLTKTAYWSDIQTNEQYFGLLAFDAGKERRICYIDGDTEEWKEEDKVYEHNGTRLSYKYDEKGMYFLIESDFWQGEDSRIWVPIDITPKSGSTYAAGAKVTFDRAADFLVEINGRTNSHLMVQERYDTIRAMYALEYYGQDFYEQPPAIDSPIFVDKLLPLTLQGAIPDEDPNVRTGETFNTGKLTYGTNNPASAGFLSLADFCFTTNGVELRIPWQILNFSNPSESQVHDDYFSHYGIENLKINQFYIGAAVEPGSSTHRIPMGAITLEPWKTKVSYHERLKESYYMIQQHWLGFP